METAKRYQFSPSKLLCHKELERKRQFRLDDEVLFLLMRIYLDSSTKYLAFWFKVSVGYGSKIFKSIKNFWAKELKPLIYWLTPEQTLLYKHPHLSDDFDKVAEIGKRTEQWIQRSSNPKYQYQTYSTHKSHNAVKMLLFCTKSGSIRACTKMLQKTMKLRQWWHLRLVKI